MRGGTLRFSSKAIFMSLAQEPIWVSMTDAAVMGLGLGLGAVGGLTFVAVTVREAPTGPPSESRPRRALVNVCFAGAIGGLILIAGSLAEELALAVPGILLMILGLIGLSLCGLWWRAVLEGSVDGEPRSTALDQTEPGRLSSRAQLWLSIACTLCAVAAAVGALLHELALSVPAGLLAGTGSIALGIYSRKSAPQPQE